MSRCIGLQSGLLKEHLLGNTHRLDNKKPNLLELAIQKCLADYKWHRQDMAYSQKAMPRLLIENKYRLGMAMQLMLLEGRMSLEDICRF